MKAHQTEKDLDGNGGGGGEQKEIAEDFLINTEFQKAQNKLIKDYVIHSSSTPKDVKKAHLKLPENTLIAHFAENLKTVKEIDDIFKQR